MVNAGVALLIGLAIIVTIGVIVALSWAAIESERSNTNGTTGPPPLAPCRQTVNFNDLLEIPDQGFNCVQRGTTGTLYYIGNLGTGTYDYVVAPWGTQPIDVCVGFCTHLKDGSCTGPNYNGRSAQSNFDQCMKQLSSTTCSPPLPIAARGPILYYAFSPTCNICDNCG